MLFREIAASNALTKQVVQEVLKNSVLLEKYVQFTTSPGSGVERRKETSGLEGQTRALGSDYANGSDLKPEYATAGRKIIGDNVFLERAYQSMGYDVNDEFKKQLLQKVRLLPRIFHNMLINGNSSSDSKQFDGLKNLVVESQKIKIGDAANGMQVITGNTDTAKKSQQALLEALEVLVDQTDGNNKVILANAKTLTRLNTIAREFIQHSKSDFGTIIRLFNLIPMINIGDFQGANIIAGNETLGTSTDCSSVYCVSFEEDAGLTFATTKEGFKVYDIVRQDHNFKSSMDLIADSLLLRDKAISKLEGIRF